MRCVVDSEVKRIGKRQTVSNDMSRRALCCGCAFQDACAQQPMYTTRKRTRWVVGVLEALACLVGPMGSKDCTAAANPNGVSGREWCYVEVGARVAMFT